MKQNGHKTPTDQPLVWREEATNGLDTIRKILLSKHVMESEKKLTELNQKYEVLFQEMEARLRKKEIEYALRFQKLEEHFELKVNELKQNLLEEITQVERKAIEHSDKKNTDFGKILIELGKEWTLGNSKE